MVRLLTGSAAGALALGALALVPAPVTAAAPDQARLTTAAPGAVAAAEKGVAARKPVRTTTVKNNNQLRAAVAKANRRSGTDKIVLSSNVRLKNGNGRGTGPLVGDLDVTDDLLVVGAGKTIDGKNNDRIFDVGPGVRLEVRNVTLRNGAPAAGESGGAVRGTQATVVAKNVTAVNNQVDGDLASGGAFFNDQGTLRIKRSTVSKNTAVRAGGAIEANAGDTSVVTSDLLQNAAGAGPGNGGAIHLTGDGTVSVDKSTAKGNTAAAEGGAFWNSDMGIFTVSETTISSNVAAGVAADNGGGALYNDGGVMSVETSQLNNNFANGTAGSGGAILNNAGDLTVKNTQMIANNANRAGGAVEANLGSTQVTDSVMRANTAGSAPGNGGALHLTGAGDVAVSGGRVEDNTATAEGGGLWNSMTGTMSVTRVKITGNSAAGADADQGGGGLYNDGGSLSVTGSELDSNDATGAAGSGGGILNNGGQLSIDTTKVNSGTAQRAGGALEAVAGTTTITGSSFESNTAGPMPGNGGAVHVTGAGSVDVTSSSFGANTATAEGGALWNSATGTMSIDTSQILGNTASGADADQGGGGVYSDGGALTITGSTIDENAADGTSGSGGGVLNKGASLTIGSTTFTGNDAKRAGGAIETAGGSVTLTQVDLAANTAGANPGNGGGFHAGGANTVVYTGGTVSNNTAANEGGGLWCGNAGNFIATGITFMGNVAPDGANVYHQDPATPATTSTCTINGTPIAQGSGTP